MCKNILNRVLVVVGIAFLGSCASYHNHVNPMEKTAAVPQLVHGPKATEYRQIEMIAAGIGALGDSALTSYQDRLESDLRHKIKSTGIVIRREGNVVNLMLPVGMPFDAMSAELRPQWYPALDALAGVLNAYQQTIVEVIGYADDDSHQNRRLPVLRAAEISSYLVAQNLRHERFEIVGLQRKRRPLADNSRVRVYASQAEIRLLPLQRTVSMQPKEQDNDSSKAGLGAGLFVSL